MRVLVSDALGWAVLHSLWEGAAIAAVLGLVLVGTRSARVRYVAACSALLALVCAFWVTFFRMLPDGESGSGILIRASVPVWREWPRLPFHEGLLPRLQALIPWVAPVWVCGVCLVYCRYAVGWWSVYGLRRRGVCSAPAIWQDVLARLARELKVSRPVVLLESFFAEAPMVIGHFRPVVLVPLSFLAGLPPDQVEAILLHELAHVKRFDYLVNVCQRLAEGLLFYHPAAWWISRVIRAERENCCDDVVVRCRGDVQSYAEALTNIEEKRIRELAVAANGGSLVKRIRRMLYPQSPSGVWAPVVAVMVLLASSGGLFAAWHASPTVQGPWQKWLNEDVVYIISDQEKVAFERLTTDEERQQFVEQFWERRDPTPGTPENEFKEEHYRRIAFANKHFRTAAGTPGWETDRGHIYIVYGPPDEIDSHPKKGDAAGGFETWVYRKVAGTEREQTFAFFDRTGGGDFRLGPANGAVK